MNLYRLGGGIRRTGVRRLTTTTRIQIHTSQNESLFHDSSLRQVGDHVLP